ncbi:hypothetical protein GCM10027449_23680 [Sinomonas notoginsengisoli]|uniref:NYN domain-containing protein n=1 Tax=Sinomonas notoginsengisoli TaxID=1457311 RepID=UPI001F2F55C4|nr:NYN domain-containing protein [Sinomonas notoginsengisoli]
MDGTATRRPNAAVFIDLENLFGGYSKDVGSVPLGAVATRLRSLIRDAGGARTTTIKAYANWAQPSMGAYQKDVLAHGIEAVQVFSFTQNVKNAADIQMCVDVLAEAQDRPWTDTFVLVSGDGGFVPLVRRLRQLDKRVIVASTNHAAAGTVNGLLATAADEYHVLEVSSPVEPSLVVKGASPTLAQYRDEIRAAVKSNASMRVGQAVNTAALGSHLRRKWSDATFKDLGAATLGSFVEEHCGLTVHRGAAPKASAVAKAPRPQAGSPAKAAPSSSAKSSENRTAYLRAVRALFVTGPLGREVDAMKRLPAARAGSLVRQHVPGTGFGDVGYGKFAVMLHDALVATPFSLDRDDQHDYVVYRRSASAAG